MRTGLRLVTTLLSAATAMALAAPAANAAAGAIPLGVMDSLTITNSTLTLTGWAFDPDFSAATLQIHVYDTTAGGTVGRAGFEANKARSDVNAAFGITGNHGFVIDIPADLVGLHHVCVYAIDFPRPLQNALLGCRDVVSSNVPFGVVDSWTPSQPQGGDLVISGWAVDFDSPQTPLAIHVYDTAVSTGQSLGSAHTSGINRSDVASAIRGAGAGQGFQANVGLSGAGVHRVCVYAIGVGTGGNSLLGCSDVLVVADQIGVLDNASIIRVGELGFFGWSLDPSDPPRAVSNTIEVRSCCTAFDPTLTIAADQSRADVGAAFPGFGNAHGFSGTVTVPPGDYQVCAAAHDYLYYRAINIGCRNVTSQNLLGDIDSVVYAHGVVTINGWAVDPYHPSESTEVHAYLTNDRDQLPIGPSTTSVLRPDVNAAVGVTGPHGFTAARGTGLLSPGDYTVSVQAEAYFYQGWVRDYYFATAAATVHVN